MTRVERRLAKKIKSGMGVEISRKIVWIPCRSSLISTTSLEVDVRTNRELSSLLHDKGIVWQLSRQPHVPLPSSIPKQLLPQLQVPLPLVQLYPDVTRDELDTDLVRLTGDDDICITCGGLDEVVE
jgi:hypothetical protein